MYLYYCCDLITVYNINSDFILNFYEGEQPIQKWEVYDKFKIWVKLITYAIQENSRTKKYSTLL